MKKSRTILLLIIIMMGITNFPVIDQAKVGTRLSTFEFNNPKSQDSQSGYLQNKISTTGSINSYPPFYNIGYHYFEVQFYRVIVYDDHEAIGAGEWYFQYRITPNPSDVHDYTVWAPFCYEWKVDGPSDIAINYRTNGYMTGEYISYINSRGFYSIGMRAWEHELGLTDPQSESEVSVDFELQGIRYSNDDFPSQIPGDEEVNHWIYQEVRDNAVKFFVKYFIQNYTPSADPIYPQNPTAFHGNPVELTGHGTDKNGDILEYEWDLDYDGTTFDVDAVTKIITPAFTQGEYRIAYRVKDPFYGQYTPASNIQETLVTVNPSDAPFIDQPEELFIERGTTDHNVTWNVTDENPNQYAITRINASNSITSQIIVEPTSWVNGSIVLNLANYPLGTYYFTCTVNDQEAHSSSSTATVHVIEKNSPIVEFLTQSLTFVEDSPGQVLTWNATDENPAFYSLSRNDSIIQDGNWNGSEIATSLDDVPEGTYLYNCTVIDQFGNSESNAIVIEVIDNKPPRIQVSVLNQSSLLPQTSITTTIIDNHVGGTYFNWDNQPNQSIATNTFTISFPGTENHHTLSIYAYDLSGSHTNEKYTFYTNKTTIKTTTSTSTNSNGFFFTIVSVYILSTVLRKKRKTP